MCYKIKNNNIAFKVSKTVWRDDIMFEITENLTWFKSSRNILSRIKQVNIPVNFLTLLILEVKLFRMMIIRVLYVCIHTMRLCNYHRDVKNMTFRAVQKLLRKWTFFLPSFHIRKYICKYCKIYLWNHCQVIEGWFPNNCSKQLASRLPGQNWWSS